MSSLLWLKGCRLDAVEDLLDHPTFEKEFTDIVKGLPDLERIVSRIHARNCKITDFIKVLGVRHQVSTRTTCVPKLLGC